MEAGSFFEEAAARDTRNRHFRVSCLTDGNTARAGSGGAGDGTRTAICKKTGAGSGCSDRIGIYRCRRRLGLRAVYDLARDAGECIVIYSSRRTFAHLNSRANLSASYRGSFCRQATHGIGVARDRAEASARRFLSSAGTGRPIMLLSTSEI